MQTLKKPTSFWRKGQRAKLAKLTGIDLPNLLHILAGRVGVSPARALLLEAASKEVLGTAIPKEAWIFNGTTDHPAFSNKLSTLKGER